MLRRAVLVLLVSCGGARPVAPPVETPHTTEVTTPEVVVSQEPAPIEELVPGFRITNYTLARETDLSGQRSGNHSRIKARGLPGTYAWEFLCSGKGVAMQGTGLTEGGQYVHYVSGGHGFCGREKNVCDCKGVQFALTDGVYGFTGRALVENYSIAVDPSVIPFGSYVWIDAMKRWFRADDRGGAILGRHIDVYVGTQPFVFNGETSVYVSNTQHQPEDPGPPSAKSACAREGLVCGGDDRPGERSLLYRCTQGRMTFARACTFGCRRRSGNGDDACNPRPPASYCAENGSFCGGERADGAPSILYRCHDHALYVETVCAQGCAIDADGVSDRCL